MMDNRQYSSEIGYFGSKPVHNRLASLLVKPQSRVVKRTSISSRMLVHRITVSIIPQRDSI